MRDSKQRIFSFFRLGIGSLSSLPPSQKEMWWNGMEDFIDPEFQALMEIEACQPPSNVIKLRRKRHCNNYSFFTLLVIATIVSRAAFKTASVVASASTRNSSSSSRYVVVRSGFVTAFQSDPRIYYPKHTQQSVAAARRPFPNVFKMPPRLEPQQPQPLRRSTRLLALQQEQDSSSNSESGKEDNAKKRNVTEKKKKTLKDTEEPPPPVKRSRGGRPKKSESPTENSTTRDSTTKPVKRQKKAVTANKAVYKDVEKVPCLPRNLEEEIRKRLQEVHGPDHPCFVMGYVYTMQNLFRRSSMVPLL
jgi:hypothetical protein